MNTFIQKIAIDMKSDMQAGFTLDDIGIVVQSHVDGACSVGEAWQSPGLTDEAFSKLCDLVIDALPHVEADPQLVAISRQAARDVKAEIAAEHRAFGLN
jgi:hypothetical protein